MTIFYKQLATDLTDSLLRAERFLTSLIDDDKKENPTDKVFSTIIPTGNVYKKTFKDKIVFNINLAGVKKDNILIGYNKNKITVDARERSNTGEKDTVFFLKEFSVPEGYDMSHIEVTYENGLLELVVKKDNDTNKTVIKIK